MFVENVYVYDGIATVYAIRSRSVSSLPADVLWGSVTNEPQRTSVGRLLSVFIHRQSYKGG